MLPLREECEMFQEYKIELSNPSSEEFITILNDTSLPKMSNHNPRGTTWKIIIS